MEFLPLYIILGLVLIIVIWLWSTYNQLTTLNIRVDEAWSDITVQLKRRADLIPNLVNTVKGYADFEQKTLTDVIEARAKATSINVQADELTPENIQKFQQAQSQLSGALSRVMVTVERYPDLKANQSFLELQAQLEGTENRIAVERQKFNEATKNYNAYIRKFPQLIYAGWFDFEKKGYFEAEASAQTAPKVEF